MNTHLPFDCHGVAPLALSRRQMLQTTSAGFGWMAFASLANQIAAAESKSPKNPLAPKAPHFPARAKRVIFLCMQGAPSHMDTFDYKPKLNADAGKGGGGGKLIASPYAFQQRGKSGLWISDLFPNLAQHADDLCLLRSMNTDIPVHAQSFTMLHTGNSSLVRPSLGAWVVYGLGKESEDLPGFISLSPPLGNAGVFGSAFLPAIYQGTHIGSLRESEDSVASATVGNIRNPMLTSGLQRQQLDFVQSMNRDLLAATGGDTEVEGVIQSYEQAFKMQSSVPRVMDLSKESKATLELYGVGNGSTDRFARQCLFARRFVEAGVRFIEITHGGWDHHTGLKARLAKGCGEIDKPIAALITDLKQRGLLKDTLIVWGGEFGRTPESKNGDGRNHNAKGFAMWMAGGGVKGGYSHGSTDEHGRVAVDQPMHIHDLHATILATLGLDHEKLTFQYAGRPFRLTNVSGQVAKDIFA
ncbi:MAG TPA: DUF1501 domain-containing protein [Verrucomicrobiaceae bacterium]|jgi:hypothetical protein